MIKKAIFKSFGDLIISSSVHIPENPTGKAVIYCHGMEGCKDGTKALYFAEEFCKLGYYFMRFDFRYSGDSEGKFEDITISGEIKDLEAAVAYLEKSLKPDEIIIIASSLGCAVSCAYASSATAIDKLILIAPPFDFKTLIKKWFAGGYELYKKAGYIETAGKKIKYTFAEDAYTFDYKKILKLVTCPTLFIHGDNDEIVDCKNSSFGIDNISSKVKKLVIIKGGDHSLNDRLDFITANIREFLNG
jgi:alpha/beta superfamily hydrolase